MCLQRPLSSKTFVFKDLCLQRPLSSKTSLRCEISLLSPVSEGSVNKGNSSPTPMALTAPPPTRARSNLKFWHQRNPILHSNRLLLDVSMHTRLARESWSRRAAAKGLSPRAAARHVITTQPGGTFHVPNLRQLEPKTAYNNLVFNFVTSQRLLELWCLSPVGRNEKKSMRRETPKNRARKIRLAAPQLDFPRTFHEPGKNAPRSQKRRENESKQKSTCSATSQKKIWGRKRNCTNGGKMPRNGETKLS